MQITLPSYKMSRVPGDVLLTRSERFKILCRGSRCLAWRSTALQLWFGAFKAVLHRFLKGLQRSPCNQEQLCAPGRTSPAASLFCEELSFEAHQACCILQPRRNKSIRLTLVCVTDPPPSSFPLLFRVLRSRGWAACQLSVASCARDQLLDKTRGRRSSRRFKDVVHAVWDTGTCKQSLLAGVHLAFAGNDTADAKDEHPVIIGAFVLPAFNAFSCGFPRRP